jgi:hypothetical protein
MRTKLDLAILPVGNNFTMDVEDAIIAADFVDCDKILGTITTLLVTSKLIINKAIQQFFDQGKDLMLLEIGESIELIFFRSCFLLHNIQYLPDIYREVLNDFHFYQG